MIERLLNHLGAWAGTKTLYDPNESGAPVTSPATMQIEALAKGLFVGLAYTWSYPANEQSQEGLLLVGEHDEGPFATWIDSWHNGRNAMRLSGSSGGEGDHWQMHGTFPAPPGPDWGWTIAVRPLGDVLEIEMKVVTPEGAAEPAVDAVFRRAP